MSQTLPLALIHGWGQHGACWQALLAALPARQVCNLELPGHGATAWAAPYFALDALVDHYAAQAPAACCVIGWSLGGQLALRWAQRYPQQVQRLVLMGATPCFGARPDWPQGSPAEVQQAFAAQIAAAPEAGLQRFADLLAAGEGDVRGARRLARAQLTARPLPDAAALLSGLEFLADTDLRAALLESPPAQPTLLIHGEGDTITACAASRWLAQTLPQAVLHELPGCGHAPMLTHADAVAAVLQKFLDE